MYDEDILLQREGEDDLSYHKRLVYGKLVDKSLADYDYAELSPYVYGKDYSADVARRLLYGSRYTLELVDNARREEVSSTGDSGMLAEIDAKMEDLKKEQKRLADQRREYNKLIAKDSRDDHLKEIIADAADKLSEEIGIMYPCSAGDDVVCGENEAVLVFSDWHYGLKASNVFNEYNQEICKERVKRATNEAIRRIRLHKCNTVHIVVLGDLYHGAISTGVRVASDELVCEQLIHSSEILAQSIYEISKHVDETCVYLTYGNHARTVANKKESIHADNMERVVNWWLIERFKNDDNILVAPVPDNEFILVDVCNHLFCATHGDLDNVQNSPRLLATLFQKKYGLDIDYILLGDKHHRESFNELGITSMLCGSLCGTDDYANGKRLYSDPSQLLLIVNEECGVDAEYRIKC